MAKKVTGTSSMTAILNGITDNGGKVLTIGDFRQTKDVVTGKYEPDYSVSANQVIYYPLVQGSYGTITDGAKLTKKKWWFNGVKVYDETDPSVVLPSYLQLGTQNGMPCLKIVNNPATIIANMAQGSKPVRFQAEFTSGATPIVTDLGGAEYIYEEISKNSPRVTLITDNGGIVDSAGIACVLTAKVDIGDGSTGKTYYYKFSNSAGIIITAMVGAGNENKIRVTDDMVNGSDYFRVDVFTDAAKTQFLASDVQSVTDVSDPVYIATNLVPFTNQILSQEVLLKAMRGMVNESAQYKMFGPTASAKDGYFRIIAEDGSLIRELAFTTQPTGGGTGMGAYFAKMTVTIDDYMAGFAKGGCYLAYATYGD